MKASANKLMQRIVDAFCGCNPVLGIALCGSYSDDLYDHASDIDVWIYHSPDTRPDDIKALVARIPGDHTLRDPHSGGYTLAEYVAEGTLISVKLINATALEAFVERQPTLVFDDVLYEDMETFMKWRILWEREAYLTSKSAVIRQRFEADNGRLLKVAERRYGDMIWRSVYQGVYREDELQWTMLMLSAMNALVVVRSLARHRAPPAMKWRFSPQVIGRLGLEDSILPLIRKIQQTSGIDSILAIYAEVRKLEAITLAHDPHGKRWWWKAFDITAQNVSLPPKVEDRIRQQFNENLGAPSKSELGPAQPSVNADTLS